MYFPVVLAALLLPGIANAQYTMVKEYIGEHFFDDWSFYNNCELSAMMHAAPGLILFSQSTTSPMAMPCECHQLALVHADAS